MWRAKSVALVAVVVASSSFLIDTALPKFLQSQNRCKLWWRIKNPLNAFHLSHTIIVMNGKVFFLHLYDGQIVAWNLMIYNDDFNLLLLWPYYNDNTTLTKLMPHKVQTKARPSSLSSMYVPPICIYGSHVESALAFRMRMPSANKNVLNRFQY